MIVVNRLLSTFHSLLIFMRNNIRSKIYNLDLFLDTIEVNKYPLTISKNIVFSLTAALLLCICGHSVKAQVEQRMLLSDIQVQVEATEAINDMYNFKFEKAEKKFQWLKERYEWHPLPYFLLGLSEWWKIMPNTANKEYDKKFLAYMDSTIMISERLYKKEATKIEAAFFLSAAYGFKGRLYSTEERKQWRKSATVGKQSLNYLEVSKGNHDLSPELLFGDGLYNYFSVWVPENYPFLKPILMFFPKGDKQLGLEQLREVSRFAFYTRTEAQVFLMRILNSYENDRAGALQIGEYLYQTYPDNAYFHRYYARLLYTSGKYTKCEKVSLDILSNIDSAKVGYESNGGRYASFFLGQIYGSRRKHPLAKEAYLKAIEFAENIAAYESGYYLYSLLYLGKIQWFEGDKDKAKVNFKKIKKHAKRGDRVHKEMRIITNN
jgi:tetratricopeptide (TPR) repeat protein